MSVAIVTSYLNTGLSYLNTFLAVPVQLLHDKLSLKTDVLPQSLNTPVSFTTICAFFLFMVIGYANTFIFNLFGILYPIVYSLTMMRTDATNGGAPDPNSEDSTAAFESTLNRYWMLFGALTLLDMLFGFVLHIIPGYSYLRIVLVYALMRNDFALTNTAYQFMLGLYEKYTLHVYLEQFMIIMTSWLNMVPSDAVIGKENN